MRYQVEKLVRVGTTGQVDANDPLLMRANPSNMVSKVHEKADGDVDDGEESEDEDGEGDGGFKTAEKAAKSQVYVPPKLSAVPFGQFETPDRNTRLLVKIAIPFVNYLF